MRILNLLLPALLLLSPVPSAATPGTGIVATVNGAEILERKLQAAVDGYLRQQGGDADVTSQAENSREVRMNVLDVLIGQELLWQAAREAQLLASDAEVDAALAQTRGRFDSETEFEIELQESGYTPETYREDTRRRLSAQKWIEARVASGIAVDDAAVSRFYNDNRERFAGPPQVRARHILLKLDADAGEEDLEAARERLAEIRQQAENGEDFASLAQTHSEDGSAARGGDLGFFGPGVMVPPFEQAAFALAAGEISDIVQTRFGLHLIQLVERKPGDIYAEAEVAGQIRNYLLRQRYETELDAAIERLRQQAEIEIANP
jgi:parvulin-like peptidyl-prolyl isomerase